MKIENEDKDSSILPHMDNKNIELMLSFFVSALKSYRRGSVCSPFPSFFTEKSKEKDFKKAVKKKKRKIERFFFIKPFFF